MYTHTKVFVLATIPFALTKIHFTLNDIKVEKGKNRNDLSKLVTLNIDETSFLFVAYIIQNEKVCFKDDY
jgi:hypothetical protein